MRREILAVTVAATFGLAATAHAAPVNDNFANAGEFTSTPSTLPLDMVGATGEAGEPTALTFSNETVWFRFVPAAAGNYTFQTVITAAGDLNSVLAYRANSCSAGFGDLTQIVATDLNDDDNANVTIAAVVGQVYWLQLDAANGEPVGGTASLSGPPVGSCNINSAGSCGAGASGTNGPDTFNGTSGIDVYNGLGGDDVISGSFANDCLAGGPGADRINGGYDNDVIRGGSGSDPELDGGYGNDSVLGGTGADLLKGGYGDDTLDARDGAGGDTVDCGAGIDTAFADPGDTVKANCETVS